MTTIYLVRHTQAEGNLYRAMQGQWDGNITNIGVKQIETLAERLKDVHIDGVYSSDLYRAYITAEKGIAEPHGLEVITDERLREIDLGPWETGFFGNIMRQYPAEAQLFMFDSEKWVFEGAETFDSVRKRMYAAIEDIAQRNEGKTVAVCSHGVSLRCFLSGVFNVDLSDVETVPICKNTAISKLEYDDGKFSVIFKNDFSHLGQYDPPKWNSTADIRDENIDFAKDSGYYLDCYEEGWRFAHEGSLDGYIPDIYLSSAKEHARDYDGAVKILYDKDKRAGVVDLDTLRGADEGYGWISLLYLEPEYRNKGYGIQALARAIMTYGEMGRNSIRLNVNTKNSIAVNFYRKYDFDVIDEDPQLLLMERKLQKRL